MKRYRLIQGPIRPDYEESANGKWVKWSDVLETFKQAAGHAASRLRQKNLILPDQYTWSDVQEVIEAAIREVIEGKQNMNTKRLQVGALRDQCFAVLRDRKLQMERIAEYGPTSEDDATLVRCVFHAVLGDMAAGEAIEAEQGE